MRLIYIFILCIVVFPKIYGQPQRKYQKIDTYSDSIVLKYLNSTYPNDSLGWSQIILKGKKQAVRNYYDYLAFSLPVKMEKVGTDTIKMINFGPNADHRPCFTLVLHKSDNVTDYFILGRETFISDILKLQNFTSKLGGEVKEKCLIEIWDLFVKCRQGIIYTPLYVH